MSIHPQEDMLTVEQRSCLLRAARRQLLALSEELDRHRAMESRYSSAVIDATMIEHECLQRAITWLWRQTSA